MGVPARHRRNRTGGSPASRSTLDGPTSARICRQSADLRARCSRRVALHLDVREHSMRSLRSPDHALARTCTWLIPPAHWRTTGGIWLPLKCLVPCRLQHRARAASPKRFACTRCNVSRWRPSARRCPRNCHWQPRGRRPMMRPEYPTGRKVRKRESHPAFGVRVACGGTGCLVEWGLRAGRSRAAERRVAGRGAATRPRAAQVDDEAQGPAQGPRCGGR